VGRVYKVVEVGTVTDEELEQVLNHWTALGWSFDGMQFAMRDSSRRPSMAFVTFTREADGSDPAGAEHAGADQAGRSEGEPAS
jgi:hypothetical protein